MLSKTSGIVLGHIPFKENSIIVRIYTLEYGSRGFIQSSAKSSKKSNKMAYFLPLSLLDLVVYHKENRDLGRISEMKFSHSFQRIPFDTTRSAIAMFLSEVLSHALRQEPGNREKFHFISACIKELDSEECQLKNFPLFFLLQLSHLLGFGPSSKEDFTEYLPAKTLVKEERVEELINGDFDSIESGSERKELLDLLLGFYKLNLENFNEIKSLPILHEILA